MIKNMFSERNYSIAEHIKKVQAQEELKREILWHWYELYLIWKADKLTVDAAERINECVKDIEIYGTEHAESTIIPVLKLFHPEAYEHINEMLKLGMFEIMRGKEA